MTIKQINAVTTEPVTLPDLKLALRIDDADLDDELNAALSAARTEAEVFTNRSFAPQTLLEAVDDFWCGGRELPRGPIDDVTKVEFLDPDGTWQIISPTNYSLFDDVLAFDVAFEFPDFLRVQGAIRVTFDSGTWTPPVPADILRGIILLTQSKVDSLADQPQVLRERAFSLLRPHRRDTGIASG